MFFWLGTLLGTLAGTLGAHTATHDEPPKHQTRGLGSLRPGPRSNVATGCGLDAGGLTTGRPDRVG
jgi:hypothetical protein